MLLKRTYTHTHTHTHTQAIQTHPNLLVPGCFSWEDLTLEILEEVIQYTLTKADTSTPLSLTIYYRSGRLSRTLLQQAISAAVPQDLVAVSLVPVLAVEDKHTLLALTATRH